MPLPANLFSQLAKFAKGNHSARLVTEDTSRRFCKALIRSVFTLFLSPENSENWMNGWFS